MSEDANDAIRWQVEDMSPDQQKTWHQLVNRVADGENLSDVEIRQLWELSPSIEVSDADFQWLLEYLGEE